MFENSELLCKICETYTVISYSIWVEKLSSG